MTKQQLGQLQPGDIVTNIVSGNGYVVLENLGGGLVVAVRTVTLTNPPEWELWERPKSNEKT